MTTFIHPRGRCDITSIEQEKRLACLDRSNRLHHGVKSGVYSSDEDEKPKTRKNKPIIGANISGTRYEIIRQTLLESGFDIVDDEDFKSCYLQWSDVAISVERITELKPFQRVNHFPGMLEICRKDFLSRNFAKMQKLKPEEYNFMPRTWVLPHEYSVFQNYVRDLKKRNKRSAFICKPANGAMGNGIRLFTQGENVPSTDGTIVQEYLDKPYLIDGFKCDLRIYVLITSCDPLRVFLYNEGLLRLSTERYLDPSDENTNIPSVISKKHSKDSLYMHLTNYSVNKHNEKYEKSGKDDTGSKRSLAFLINYLRGQDCDVQHMWKNIIDVIIKTLVMVEPHLLHAYRMCRPGQNPSSDSVCFEILGFDIILDHKLRPWLLEVNRSPSFGTDEELDKRIKTGLLKDTFKLLNIRASDKKRNQKVQKIQAQRRLMKSTRPDISENQEVIKRRKLIEKKRDDLRDVLIRLRSDSAREDFENRNSGNFRRIFPPDDKFRQKRYASLLTDVFNSFSVSRGQKLESSSLQREIDVMYEKKLKEEDILDMLAQYEAEYNEVSPNKFSPLKKINEKEKWSVSLPNNLDATDSDSSSSSSDDEINKKTHPKNKSRKLTSTQRSNNSLIAGNKTSTSSTGSVASRKLKISASSSNLRGDAGSRLTARLKIATLETTSPRVVDPKAQEELLKELYAFLKDMRIRFPGKSDHEAQTILNKLKDYWNYHKSRIAHYWLIQLDSAKRSKVIDIVRTNVRTAVEKIFREKEGSQARINRLINKLYNKLEASYDQGLWNTFIKPGMWESMFSKSSDSITSLELDCLRRVVELCQECLLVVYCFANESRGQSISLTSWRHERKTSTSSSHAETPEQMESSERYGALDRAMYKSTPRAATKSLKSSVRTS